MTRKLFKVPSDLLIFGLTLNNINEPFQVGNLNVYPGFDLRKYLDGYDPSDINFIVDDGAVFARYQSSKEEDSFLFSPLLEDDCLIPFRLLKHGWLSAISVIPVSKSADIEIQGTIGPLKQIFGQIWAQPMHYELSKKEIPKLRGIHSSLSTIPRGFLEVALRMFSRSYEYYTHSEYVGISELDECLVDLVIALESMLSRGGDSIRQSLALRSALLLGKDFNQRKNIERLVKKCYDHRSEIVHARQVHETSEKHHTERFTIVEEFRTIVRKAINICVEILNSYSKPSGDTRHLPGSMAEVVDDYLFREYGSQTSSTRSNSN